MIWREVSMIVIDSHTHLGEFPLFNVRLDAEGVIDIMDRWGFSWSVVF